MLSLISESQAAKRLLLPQTFGIFCLKCWLSLFFKGVDYNYSVFVLYFGNIQMLS
jgi:hypothetical protein